MVDEPSSAPLDVTAPGKMFHVCLIINFVFWFVKLFCEALLRTLFLDILFLNG